MVGVLVRPLLKTIFLFCIYRKREEEQRRREAVHHVTVDGQSFTLKRTEQKTDSLVDVIENLTMKDSMVETKKSSKAEHTANKAERPKGRHLFSM